MRVTLHEVSKGHALPLTSLEFHTGAVRFAIAETEQRPTVLGLIASGRMKPATGTVTIDGATDNRMLRRSIALVDAPDVSDPHADIMLVGVVAEELMFAGRLATPLHARRWLNEAGFGDLASVQVGNIDPSARVRIMCELAILREGTEGIVLVSPDRHGGSPDGWWRIAGEFADRGYAMLVVVGGSAAVALERMDELGAVNASGPIEPLVLDAAAPADENVEITMPESEYMDGEDTPREDIQSDANPENGIPTNPESLPGTSAPASGTPGPASGTPATATRSGGDTPDIGHIPSSAPRSGVSSPDVGGDENAPAANPEPAAPTDRDDADASPREQDGSAETDPDDQLEENGADR